MKMLAHAKSQKRYYALDFSFKNNKITKDLLKDSQVNLRNAYKQNFKLSFQKQLINNQTQN
jgi:hypothetical protein